MTTNTDMIKLENAAIKLIEETLASGKTLCLFDQHKLLLSLQVSSLKIRHMHSELSDVLSGTAICRKYGQWATGEHESDVHYLVRLCEPKQSVEELALYIEHKAPERAARRRVYQLEVPKEISADQAQKFLDQVCSQFLNSGNVADLHDEDIRRQAALNDK